MIKMKDPHPKLLKLLRHVPLLIMLSFILFFLLSKDEISVERLLSYSPENPLLAACFLLLAFAVKSLSVMFPVLVIFVAGGILFPPVQALAINTLGIAVTLSIPYWIGRMSGADLTVRLAEKYPKIYELRSFRKNNNFFFSYIVRVIGILPCDIVSLYMGSVAMPYPAYISGAVLGFMPDLILATIVGIKITDTSSPWFWLSITAGLLISAASVLIYRIHSKKEKKENGKKANHPQASP